MTKNEIRNYENTTRKRRTTLLRQVIGRYLCNEYKDIHPNFNCTLPLYYNNVPSASRTLPNVCVSPKYSDLADY